MAVSQGGSSNDHISPRDIHDNLLARGTLRTHSSLPVTREIKDSDLYVKEVHPQLEPIKNKRSLPWYVFAIPVGVFIANIAIQSMLGFTQDTNNFINIVVVIGIITAFWVYTRNYFGGKNG